MIDVLKEKSLVVEVSNRVGAVLVVGAGISGMQAALDLADNGYYVYLLDQEQAIGGIMSRLDKTFPTNDCAMCVMSPKLVDCGRHLNIEIITYADVKSISGEPGNYQVKIVRRAKSIDEEKCTGCGDCITNCPSRYRIKPPAAEIRYSPKLSEDDIEFISNLLESKNGTDEGLLSILHKVNTNYRYLPEHILEYISDKTSIPLAQLVSVATFYNAFSLEPKGEHTISICTGTVCHVKGSGILLARLEEILGISEGQTTSDGKFSIRTVRHIGCCALAPVMRIDEETFGKVKPTNIEKIISKF
jgi:NADH:ubiquinone oxidoreductase subunit E/NAD-dependent dihydropyrimidine dehydrogenase PreA subunit